MNCADCRSVRDRRESGLASVEFALVAIVFFTVLLGIMEFGRWLYTLNSASEATRLGARTAVVCDLNDSAIKTRMLQFLPGATASNIQITYAPTGCSVNTCVSVTVNLTGYTMPLLVTWFPFTAPIPSFTTTLPRESLLSVVDTRNNPICL